MGIFIALLITVINILLTYQFIKHEFKSNIIIPYTKVSDYIDKDIDNVEAIKLIVIALQENEANKISKPQESFRPCHCHCSRCCKSQLNTPQIEQ